MGCPTAPSRSAPIPSRAPPDGAVSQRRNGIGCLGLSGRDTGVEPSRQSTVQAFVDRFPTDDIVAAVRDPDGLQERLAPLADLAWPNFEVVMVGPMPTARIEYRGVGGLIEAWTDWASPYERYEMQVESIEEAGDRALVVIHQAATPTGATAAMEGTAAALFTFRDGRLSSIEFHLDADLARREAGL